MKIYTKKGDQGFTSLIGGTRVPKYHVRVEAYGTVDELISFIGLIRDQTIHKHHQEILLQIQDRLMACASILAADCENCDVKLPLLKEDDVELLEKEIDTMEKKLPPLSSFLLPGGHTTVSYCHVARCVCRRAERTALKMGPDVKGLLMVVKYLNRLADYLYVLARALGKELGAKEIPWKTA
jgi:cob(I)alamin adenosyltransferase